MQAITNYARFFGRAPIDVKIEEVEASSARSVEWAFAQLAPNWTTEAENRRGLVNHDNSCDRHDQRVSPTQGVAAANPAASTTVEPNNNDNDDGRVDAIVVHDLMVNENSSNEIMRIASRMLTSSLGKTNVEVMREIRQELSVVSSEVVTTVPVATVLREPRMNRAARRGTRLARNLILCRDNCDDDCCDSVPDLADRHPHRQNMSATLTSSC